MANWYVWQRRGRRRHGRRLGQCLYDAGGGAARPRRRATCSSLRTIMPRRQASAMTITSPGTETMPCRIYCVNRAGSVPPVSADLRTTATISTTGAFGITLAGSCLECYGIIFNCGTGATSASLVVGNTASRTWRLVNCSLRLLTTAGGSRINPPGAGRCQYQSSWRIPPCNSALSSQLAQCNGRAIWRNTPTALLGADHSHIPAVFHRDQRQLVFMKASI